MSKFLCLFINKVSAKSFPDFKHIKISAAMVIRDGPGIIETQRTSLVDLWLFS